MDDYLSALLTNTVDTCIYTIINNKALLQKLNEYHLYCFIFRQWKSYFSLLTDAQLAQNNPDMVIMGVKLPLTKQQVEETLKLFQEIDSENVFEPFEPEDFM